MDGYKPHRILIRIGFLCQRIKANSSSHRCRVCSPRTKLFSATLPSTHFALNPPSRIHASPSIGKPTLHTHTASLPGPRGPGSHDSDLTRPARPIVPVTSPLDHSTMPGAHLPSALRVTTETLSLRGPGHLPSAQGHLPPASGAPQASHLPPASRCDPLPRGHGILTTGPKPTALGPRPDPRSQ
jgi:hypothetical protein